jgi:hypothetical protein
MWRDELQAWLLARDSSNVLNLFANLKYEGHPALWHLLLFPLTRVFDSPYPMQYLHVLIATGSIYVITTWSPFSVLQKFLLIFNYFMFFEYSLISRNYAIGVLLLFIFCAIFPRRFERPLSLAIILALLSHTSVFGLILAICLFSILIYEAYQNKNNDNALRIKKSQFYLQIFVILLGVFLAIWQLKPPADSGYAVGWKFDLNLNGIMSVSRAIVNAYLPIPDFDLHFWTTPLTKKIDFFGVVSAISVAWLMFVFSRFFVNRPAALIFYVMTSISLVLFFYIKFSGFVRHHGFLFIALIVALWISKYCKTNNDYWLPKILPPYKHTFVSIVFSIVLVIHATCGVYAAQMDYKYLFSAAKETAEFIKKNNLQSYLIIGDSSYATSAVSGYLTSKPFFYRDADRFGTFIRWDNLRRQVDESSLLKTAYEFIKQSNAPGLFILNYPLITNAYLDMEIIKIYESSDSVVRDEKFYVYQFFERAVSMSKCK